MHRTILVGIVILGLAAAAQTPEQGKEPKPPPTLAALLKQLKAKEPEARTDAVAAIAKLDAKVAVPALADVLAMPDEELRLHAALALGGIGTAAVPALEKALGDTNETVRFYAVWALGLAGPAASSATPAIIKALRDEDEEVRYKAAFALARVAPDSEEAVAALVKALADADFDVVSEASAALARLGPRAVPALRQALMHDKLGLRAAETLSTMAQSEDESAVKAAAIAVPDILQAFDGRRSTDMNTLLTVLPAFGTKGLPAFHGALKARNVFARARLAQAVGQIGANAEAMGDGAGAKAAVELLILMLADDDPRVRAIACVQLGPINLMLDLSQPALEKVFLDDTYTVSAAAFGALTNKVPNYSNVLAKRVGAAKGDDKLRLAGLVPSSEFKLLTANLKHPQLGVRCACALAAHASSQPGNEELRKQIEPILVNALEDSQATRHRDAAQALLSLAPQSGKSVVAPLLAALKDDDSEVRSMAIWALVQNPTRDLKQAAAAAAALLNDPVVWVQESALNMLPQCGAAATPHLIGLLKSGDLQRRMVGCKALKATKDQSAEVLPALAAMARDAEHRWLAAQTLHEIAAAKSFTLLLDVLQEDKVVGPRLRRLDKAAKDPDNLVRALVRDMKSDDPKVKHGAAGALAQVMVILPPADCLVLKRQAILPAIKALVQLLSKELTTGNATTRREAVEVLGELRMLNLTIEQRTQNSPNPELAILINEISPNQQDIDAALGRARGDSDTQVRRLARAAVRAGPYGDVVLRVWGGVPP